MPPSRLRERKAPKSGQPPPPEGAPVVEPATQAPSPSPLLPGQAGRRPELDPFTGIFIGILAGLACWCLFALMLIGLFR